MWSLPCSPKLDQDMDQARGRLFELLCIPISARNPSINQTCNMLLNGSTTARGSGLQGRGKPNAGHPVVLGHYPSPSDTTAPRILFYELWQSPPFDPQIVAGPHGPGWSHAAL
jgi:hypothetical protein